MTLFGMKTESADVGTRAGDQLAAHDQSWGLETQVAPPPTNVRSTPPKPTPVAVKVTGLPAIPEPAAVAVRVFVPAAAPSVQLPMVAMPLEPVVCDVPVTLPPPVATAKVTATPPTGFAYWSVTRTAGGTGTAVPVGALWLFPAATAICAAGPAVPVAVKVTGLPVMPEPVAVAVRVFVPAVVP